MVHLPRISLLGKAVVTFVALVLGLSFLFAPKPHPVDISSANFEMTSSARLYFRNIRSYYYDIKPHEASHFILYQLKSRERDTLITHLDFTIVENTLQGEAYIYLDLSTPGKQYAQARVLLSNYSSPSEAEPLYDLNNEGHFRTAAFIWKGLLQDEKFYLLDGLDTITKFLNNPRHRSNAEIVLEDYFKLTGKL